MPRNSIYLIPFESALSLLMLWIAVSLRTETWFLVSIDAFPLIILSLLAPSICLHFNGVYRSLDSHLNRAHTKQILKAMMCYGVLFLSACLYFHPSGIPRSVGIIQPIFLLVAILISRALIAKWFDDDSHPNEDVKQYAWIYGCGSAGKELVSVIETRYHICGFVDDDVKKQDLTFRGYKIFSPDILLETVPEGNRPQIVLLALPSVSGTRREQIFNELSELGYVLVTVSNLVDLILHKSSIDQVRPLILEDLLERPITKPDDTLMRQNIENKIILVTGAGGSIGSELCRQIVRMRPAQLVMVDHSEINLFNIDRELRDTIPNQKIISQLSSVCDVHQMAAIFNEFNVDTIFHAAAYKHVHLLESNASTGLVNNALGTKIIIDLAIRMNVDTCVMISTDKAVRPESIMGISKRVAELLVNGGSQFDRGSKKIRFATVRFGNVLGSSGSVIPIFQKQIEEGGPVTVTDENATRYFMTISEAAALVIQAGALSQKNDLFILDMGRPVSIWSLAEKLIRLSGKVPTRSSGDGPNAVQIRSIGLRNGEKLHEELTINTQLNPTSHPKIFRVDEPDISEIEYRQLINYLDTLDPRSYAELVDFSKALVCRVDK
jgi:FlaA1/EpsC-like NDP-sugar epimerase